MKTIELTDEQAKWLRDHLDSRAADLHYSGRKRTDADEHNETILEKLKREIDKDRW